MKLDKYQIKCGNCQSEYNPRLKSDSEQDCSCPVCGHGKFSEATKPSGQKKILKDTLVRTGLILKG